MDQVNARIHELGLNASVSPENIPESAFYSYDPGTATFSFMPGGLPPADPNEPNYIHFTAQADGNNEHATATVYEIEIRPITGNASILVIDNEVVGYRDMAYGNFYLTSLQGYTNYSYTFDQGKVSQKTKNQGGGMGQTNAQNVYAENITLTSDATSYVAPSNGNEVRAQFSAGTTLTVLNLEQNGYYLAYTLDSSVAPSWIAAKDIGK